MSAPLGPTGRPPILREWDATTYDRVADPMARWGTTVLDRLPLSGRERVLDAGCGSGRVTEQLLERLPDGHVVALDASAAMIEATRVRLAGSEDRVTFVVADLLDPLGIEPVDAVLSTATFHWILDHDRLFANLAAVLRPGGRLVAQCGGAGNIAAVLATAATVGRSFGLDPEWAGPWRFAGADETADRLRAAGFVEVATWTNPEPTTIEPGPPLEAFLATVILRTHVLRLAEADRPAYVSAVAAAIGAGPIDYVRLNILARHQP